MIGQVKTRQRSNETTAIPAFLDLLDVAGCVMTIDAMGCQKAMGARIRDKGADCLLVLKGNHAYECDEVWVCLADARERGNAPGPISRPETRDYEQGRREMSRTTVTSEMEWLTG